ncbi:unnamed protein product [Polarella glacialis]|uniref:EF-hand domain-containing protein n=1 Tax=Polarella glacialis TaxID=89957 RepID=A0A813KQY2_POLGL|nr:unnamed protein product [Polarella glacialis]
MGCGASAEKKHLAGPELKAPIVEPSAKAVPELKAPVVSPSIKVDVKPKAAEELLPECRFRIFHINDTYLLDNLPALKSCVKELSKGFPPSNILTVLPGDFLAPSLLSSLDQGQGMLDVLNQVPIDVVCFGNHEADIPHLSLVKRIGEFKGIWLNSNMPGFEPACPDNHLVQLEGGRSVALIGLLAGGGKDAALYRDGAFNGAAEKIIPVLDAVDGAVARAREAHPQLDMILPLTHQRIPDDILLAQKGHGFPVIIGGHDHWEVNEVHNGTRIVKAGEDAYKCSVIDIVWAAGTPRCSPPTSVSVELKDLALHPKHKGPPPVISFQPDEELASVVLKWMQPAIELAGAVLSDVDTTLSSKEVRDSESSLATFLCTAMKETCKTEGALINSGGVRGKKVYTEGFLTFADLNREVPFPSANVVVRVPGKVLSDGVAASRATWREDPPKPSALAFHCDNKILVDPATGAVLKVNGEDLEDDRLYSVIIDAYMMQVNPVFKVYADAFPERIPPDDAGRPALPILVQYFCDQVWLKLVGAEHKGDVDLTVINQLFDEVDVNKNGELDAEELQQVIARKVGARQASTVLVRQVLNAADLNKDGTVCREELQRFLRSESKTRGGRH